MKLQRTTLVLLATAVLLGGFVYFYEVQGAQRREVVKTKKQSIFSFKADQIQSLTIYTNKETLEFERTTQPAPGWQMKTPKDTLASDAAVSFLVNLLVEGKSDRSFPILTTKRQEYGLDQPIATVKVQLKNQQTHRLILGKPDFNRSFLYAQADPPAQMPAQLKVLLVPIDFEYAVTRPLSEWQHQEDVPETPAPSPTPQTSASPEPSPTPEKSPSPQPSPAKQTPSRSAPSPTPEKSPTPQPSPAKETPSRSAPSPTPEKSPTPQPSPTKETPSRSAPSPTPEKPGSPKPSPAEQN